MGGEDNHKNAGNGEFIHSRFTNSEAKVDDQWGGFKTYGKGGKYLSMKDAFKLELIRKFDFWKIDEIISPGYLTLFV